MKSRHLVKIIVFFLVWAAAYPMYAQNEGLSDNETIPLKTGTFGRIQFGGSFINLDELNPVLESKEFLPITESFFAMGVGLSRMKNKWIVGADSYNYMISESNLDNQLAVLGFHYTTVNAGYLMFRKGNDILIYPLVGIGGGFTSLKSKPYDQQFPVTFRAVGWLGDVSLNFRKISPMRDEKGTLIELGLQAGYLYAAPSSGFKLKKFEPDTILNVNPGGLYFRLSLGMGKMR